MTVHGSAEKRFEQADGRGAVRILCVDDEENPLKLRKLVLERQGYEVVTANSSKQALEVLTTAKIDLVLSDQLMPGGSGTELAKAIKSRYPLLPVVLISGVNEIPPDAIHADLFLSKVEGPASMCKKIAEVLAQRQRP
jgi:DNA-binding NtrC family response regulator